MQDATLLTVRTTLYTQDADLRSKLTGDLNYSQDFCAHLGVNYMVVSSNYYNSYNMGTKVDYLNKKQDWKVFLPHRLPNRC